MSKDSRSLSSLQLTSRQLPAHLQLPHEVRVQVVPLRLLSRKWLRGHFAMRSDRRVDAGREYPWRSRILRLRQSLDWRA